MIEFVGANMAPIMFVGLIVFMLFGYSVAFSLAACGLFFGWLGVELGLLPQTLLQALPLRIFGIMQNDTLLAIPFFTFMGLVLERSRHGRGPARYRRTAVRADPRRPRLCGDPRRRDARRRQPASSPRR